MINNQITECFQIALAGKIIEIHSLYSYIKEYCKGYITEGQLPDFVVETQMQEIDFEKKKSAEGSRIEGIREREYADEYLETLAIYRKIATKMLDYDIFLFHGSVIAVDGIGYLFTAKSGTGKSTHARLWRELFGERAVMINDDKPLIQITDHGVLAYGTPWDGKHHLSSNTGVPLKAICILNRSEINEITGIDKREVLPILCQQSYRPSDPTALMKTLSLVDKLGDSVKLYRLKCNMEPEAARISYAGMNK